MTKPGYEPAWLPFLAENPLGGNSAFLTPMGFFDFLLRSWLTVTAKALHFSSIV